MDPTLQPFYFTADRARHRFVYTCDRSDTPQTKPLLTMDILSKPEFKSELAIIRLANNISKSSSAEKRSSDVSTDSTFGGTTPAGLAVELVHYKVGTNRHRLRSICTDRDRNSSPNYASPITSKLRRRNS